MSRAQGKIEAAGKRIAKSAPSAGGTFPDGTALELIRGPRGNLKFLTWDGHNAGTGDQFLRGDVIYTPPEIHSSISDSIVLPSGLADCGTTRELFDQITGLIRSACGGSKSVAVPLTFLVFATWFQDLAPVAPFVWVVVPATCDTAALTQMLRLLCRHALLMSCISPNWFGSLPQALQPTLIAEVDGPARRLLSALRASQTHCLSPTGAGRVFDPFCAKVVFGREALEDPAAAGYPLVVFLKTNNRYVPPLDSAQAAQVAEECQNKLLRYRLTNYSKIPPPSFDLSQFRAPVQALAHSFAGPIVGDDDLQAQLVPYLSDLDSEIQTDRDSTLDTMIVEDLLTRCSESEIGVTDICDDVNTLIVGRGGSNRLSPEKVGRRLRGLGLRTTHNAPGYKVLRMADARAKILRLAQTFGLAAPEGLRTSPQDLTRRQPKDDRNTEDLRF